MLRRLPPKGDEQLDLLVAIFTDIPIRGMMERPGCHPTHRNTRIAVRAIKEGVRRAVWRSYEAGFKIENEIARPVMKFEDSREGPRTLSRKNANQSTRGDNYGVETEKISETTGRRGQRGNRNGQRRRRAQAQG
jgi:hypothetical protein